MDRFLHRADLVLLGGSHHIAQFDLVADLAVDDANALSKHVGGVELWGQHDRWKALVLQGWLSNCLAPEGGSDHAGFSHIQNTALIVLHGGLSNMLSFTASMPTLLAGSEKTAVPHLGQKLRLASLPERVDASNEAILPVIFTLSFGVMTKVAGPPPEACRH